MESTWIPYTGLWKTLQAKRTKPRIQADNNSSDSSALPQIILKPPVVKPIKEDPQFAYVTPFDDGKTKEDEDVRDSQTIKDRSTQVSAGQKCRDCESDVDPLSNKKICISGRVGKKSNKFQTTTKGYGFAPESYPWSKNIT